jgi:hypothetical protein
VADFNGDGKPDLAVANFSSNTVSILLGNGDGTFQPQTTYAVGTSPIWIAAADFNGNGIIDLVTANSGSSNVSILLGKGDGTFMPQTTTAVSSDPSWVAVGDFNGDGFPDLVVTIPQTILDPDGKPRGTRASATEYNVVGVLLGNGDGTFQPPVNYPLGTNPYCVAVADFNGDGKLDLAVGDPYSAGYGSYTVTIMLGNGDGSFTREVVDWATGYGPFPLLVADLNGDGKPDLVAGGTYLTVLTNTTPF